MIKLSIIVPIYNVEQYLRKCVDSLLNQDIDNYEVILVDDGSPDACPAICDDYVRRLENGDRILENVQIRVIHRENGGLSAARNSGIKVAKGEYIMFVDSDDYIEPNVLGGLLAQIEREELDVLRYNFQNVRVVDAKQLDSANSDAAHLEYEVFEPYRAAKRDVDYSETVTDGEDFLNNRLGPMCYVTQFVIKLGLIEDYVQRKEYGGDCLFKEGIFFEDTEWTPRMLLRAKRVASTGTVVYNYFWREGSISLPDNPQKREKVIRDKIALIREFKKQSKMVNDPQWFTWMTSFTAMTVLDALTTLTRGERKTYIGELKTLDIFPLNTAKEKIRSHKIKVQMANVSPMLYCIVMRVVKSVRCKVKSVLNIRK